MSPLLPGLSGSSSHPSWVRGSVYWADPHFPTGKSNTKHRCVLLRTPRSRETNVPLLTLHTLSKKPDAVNDCCLELDAKSYRGLKVPTVIDARMTMFAPVLMLREFCFELSADDLAELEVCLAIALELVDE